MKRVFIPLLTVAAVVSIVLAGCAPTPTPPAPTPPAPTQPAPTQPAPTPTPPEAPLTVRDVPELQELVAKGTIDPSLEINPYEGLGIKPDGTPYKFAMSISSLGNDWYATGFGLMRSLFERSGAQVVAQDAEDDVAAQVGFFDDQIATVHPDGITVQAVSTEALIPCVAEAMNAGIPVISWDDVVEGALLTPRHALDGPQGTVVVGEYFVKWAEETGKELYIYEIWCPRSYITCHNRSAGLHRAVDKCPLIKEVIPSPDNACSDEVTYDLVRDAFLSHPELNAIFCMDGGGGGAIEALKSMNRYFPCGHPDHVLLAFNDVDTRTVEAMDEGGLDAFASHTPWDLVDVTVKAMFTYVILEQPVPKEMAIPMILITFENIDTAQLFGVPAAYPRMPAGQFDLWPVMDTRELGLPTPTKAMLGD